MMEYIDKYLASIGREREHMLRGILQDQLGRHWLSIHCPEPVLEKIRNPDGKVA
jgi:hypothetical protein